MRDEKLLNEKITNKLFEIAGNYEIKLEYKNISDQFEELIKKIHNKFNRKVVILIDEYDKPILDNITDISTASEMREGLKNLYSVIKSADEYIKFVFLTGVSKFSKVSIFSGLNNLEDITLNEEYATILSGKRFNINEPKNFDKYQSKRQERYGYPVDAVKEVVLNKIDDLTINPMKRVSQLEKELNIPAKTIER